MKLFRMKGLIVNIQTHLERGFLSFFFFDAISKLVKPGPQDIIIKFI